MPELVIGDRVTYKELNLRDRGTLVALGKTPRGGDSRVQWDRFPTFTTEECLRNLAPLE